MDVGLISKVSDLVLSLGVDNVKFLRVISVGSQAGEQDKTIYELGSHSSYAQLAIPSSELFIPMSSSLLKLHD